MAEYKRITITMPDGSQVFRMIPEGLGAEGAYSQAQSGKSWAKDYKPAESAGVTRPTRPDNPSRIDTSIHPEELPEDPGIVIPPSLALKRFVETVAHGAWEVFKNVTGISTWEETLEILDDPELTPEQKRQRMQAMTQYSIFDLVSIVHIPGMSELTNLAVNPVRQAIKEVGETLFDYMRTVGRYLGELTGLQAEILSKAEKRALANAARLNKTIPAEITNPLERAARVVEKLDLELYVKEGQTGYLKALASRTEEPPNAYMAVVGSRDFSDEAAVHGIVKRLVDNGYGIASGGATGADHFALTAITNLNPKAGKIYTVGDLDPQVVNPGEVEPLLELLRQGGDLRIGQIHAPAGYEEYSKALLKRSDDLVRDPTVQGVVAFLEPGADNSGTWHTVGRAIAEEKRMLVYSTDPDLLQTDFVKDGHWSPLEHNPNFYQWVTTGDRIAFVDEVTGEVDHFVVKNLPQGGYSAARQAVEKRGGSPALIARESGQAITFPRTGAQLQDWELLSQTGSSSFVLTKEGKAYRFVPEGEDPGRFAVQEVKGSQAVQLIVDGVVETEPSFPQAIRKIYRKSSRWGSEPPPDWSVKDYTFEAKSLQEAIEKANPDERPQFANDLDRMIWEGFMSSKATLAFREDIATEKGYRQILHISSQTGASFEQANELHRAWDTIGDTPELYRFHYEEVRRFKKEAKAAGQAEEEGLTKAMDHYRNLAGELEKDTRVKDTDVMGALQRSY
ncbi:MAG: hypothetical protein HYY01_15370, partial [Chloroflexi bacterium]|nr:hypothetical protein [Chloroflexota bacterium]